MTQFVASSFGELGVQSQYLDGELHLVDDSLAGAMAAGEKFEVFRSVIRFYSVYVMHRFFGKQGSSDALFHDVAVLKDIAGRFCSDSGHYESHVPPSAFPSCDFLVWVVFAIRQSPKQRATFGAAQRFLSVYRAARFSLYRHAVSALDANNVPVFIGQATPDSSTPGRAVHRVFAEFLSVFAQVRRLVFKRCAADFAGERSDFCMGGRPSMFRFMEGFARSPAKTLVGVRGFDLERGQALFTAFLDRHFVGSLFVATSLDSTTVCLSK